MKKDFVKIGKITVVGYPQASEYGIVPKRTAYRSPDTNELLRKCGRGAAKNSYHIKGQAVDIRIPGYKTSVLRKAAYELKIGGAGYYPKRRFVHVDVGPVRYWIGN